MSTSDNRNESTEPSSETPEKEAKSAPADVESKEVQESEEKTPQPKANEPSVPNDAKSTGFASLFSFLLGGNRLRLVRGGLLFLIGLIVPVLIMGRDNQSRFGVPIGLLFVLLAAFGALDLVGSFDDQPRGQSKRVWNRMFPEPEVSEGIVDIRHAAIPFGGFIVVLLTTLTLMAYATGVVWGIALAFGWAATAILGFRVVEALGLTDKSRGLFRREGFFLILFCCALFLPTLGAHSLVDPWETHYGEVAREILARDDWITLWWAEEGFFLSKPILDFWLQALAMAFFGAGYLPDKMIAPKEIGGEPLHPEWIVRFPSLVLSVIALYLAYRAISQVFGRRSGLFGSMVLATMADYAMLTHQSITDTPFVTSLTASMSLLILGITTDANETVRPVRIRVGTRTFSFSGYHLALGLVLIAALPQAFYLISRNFELISKNGPIAGYGIFPHGDEYKTGSGMECWLPPGQGSVFERAMRTGKWSCDSGKIAYPAFQPVLQGVLWIALLFGLLFWNRNERRVSRLYILAAWVFAALSTMAKGIAGFLLPVAVAGAYIVAARKWKDIGRFEWVSGLLILATVAAPWFVASYARMGDEFYQQLFVHHMFKRALDHVHDTNVGDDVSIRYFVWQLGYALFPWVGAVPAGLVWWARNRWSQFERVLTVKEERKRDVSIFLVMWFLIGFTLFTYMGTKFHHYIFPAVPPAGLLTGIYLSEALGDKPIGKKISWAWVAASALGVAIAVYGFSRLTPGPFFGKILQGEVHEPSLATGLLLGVTGLVLCMAASRLMEGNEEDESASAQAKRMMVAATAIAAVMTTVVVTRDLTSQPTGDIKGQERLIHLFTYRYDRAWPRDLLFNPALLGFGITASMLFVLMAARALRRQAVVGLLTVGALFAAWNLDFYMVHVAPHWGQRTVFETYYRDRKSVNEPLVAFEMNWKGENFYSGGRLVEFGNGFSQGTNSSERGSDKLRGFILTMKSQTKAIYFITELGRASRVEDMLRATLGAPPSGRAKWLEQISTDQTSNKFYMFRARWG